MPDGASDAAMGYTPFEVDAVSPDTDYMLGSMRHGKATLTSLSGTDEAESIGALSDDADCGYMPPSP